jgi:hypothetical protein
MLNNKFEFLEHFLSKFEHNFYRRGLQGTPLYKRNEEIMKEILSQQVTELIAKCRGNWKEHVGRMTSGRILRKILK